MLIRAYGLFWREDEIDWSPGSGNKSAFRLLGRHGANLPGLRVADFRTQHGLYILYGNYGAYYVGIAQNLGKRLKDHRSDEHAGQWDRFSWFGFSNVLAGKDSAGLHLVKPLKLTVGTPANAVSDIEALLIHAIGPSNTNKMKFKRADPWLQVRLDERDKYLAKVRPA